MERVKSFRSFTVDLENNNSFLGTLFLLVLGVHLSFLMSTDHFQRNLINYSQNISEKVSVKVKLSTLRHRSIAPPQLEKKSFKRKALKKKIMPKRVSQRVLETREVKENLGQNDLLAMYMSNVRRMINEKKVYPSSAKRLKQQGRIKLELIIDKNGDIISKKYLKKSNSIFLDDAVEKIFKSIKSFGKIPTGIKKLPLKIIVPIVYELV